MKPLRRSYCNTYNRRPKTVPPELDANIIEKLGRQLRYYYDAWLTPDLPPKMAELVARLRAAQAVMNDSTTKGHEAMSQSPGQAVFDKMIDAKHRREDQSAEIERLQAENARLRAALKEIVQRDKRFDPNCTSQDTGEDGPCAKIARAALQYQQTESKT